MDNKTIRQAYEGFESLHREESKLEDIVSGLYNEVTCGGTEEQVREYHKVGKRLEENRNAFTLQVEHLSRLLNISVEEAMCKADEYLERYSSTQAINNIE